MPTNKSQNSSCAISIDPNCDWIDQIPDELMKEYFKIADERLFQIFRLIQEIETNPSDELYVTLKTIVHKIAGSAGMYGRQRASDLCKKMEINLEQRQITDSDLKHFYCLLSVYIK